MAHVEGHGESVASLKEVRCLSGAGCYVVSGRRQCVDCQVPGACARGSASHEYQGCVPCCMWQEESARKLGGFILVVLRGLSFRACHAGMRTSVGAASSTEPGARS